MEQESAWEFGTKAEQEPPTKNLLVALLLWIPVQIIRTKIIQPMLQERLVLLGLTQMRKEWHPR
ncbi:MAG: hypothetical protein EBV34_20230 [Betaproteobacteria bacterium]|nr:hypothetical protein [Betaproteobacteria bacterium]